MTTFEQEPSSEMLKDFSTSPETERKQEVVQLTFEEFLKCVDKHEKACDDIDCKFSLAKNEQQRGRRWDQAAYHMLLMTKLMPLFALHLDSPGDHVPDPNETVKAPHVRAQILIPEAELERPWACAYLHSCGESVRSKDLFYSYTPEQARYPKKLSKQAFKYIYDEAPLMEELARITNNTHPYRDIK